MTPLLERVARDLAADLPHEIGQFARHLAEETAGVAVLFYGSVLRTGNLDDLLDFYVLTDSKGRPPLIWPRISFPETTVGARVLRAKVATMPMAVFAEAANGRRIDTTVWTRFCQPCALAWARDAAAERLVGEAVAGAIETAAVYAAALGPERAPATAFWTGLFDRTYDAEFRVEAPGRSATIVAHAPERYAELLPLAWAAGGIDFVPAGECLEPRISPQRRRSLASAWGRRARLGKPLNVLRLVKAALTIRDVGSYALWKIERHTGVRVEPTRWRREHPVLATPGVLWQLFRARARRPQSAVHHDPHRGA